MFYILYYIKKLWYIPLIILFISLLVFLFNINNKSLMYYFEPFINKISFTPEKYETSSIEDTENYLKDLKVLAPYLGSLDEYVPKSIVESGQQKEFLKKMKESDGIMYKKNIDWSSGSISNDEYIELMELVGYHLNKNSNNIVKYLQTPSMEQLSNYNKSYCYYNNNGTLELTAYVDEIDITLNEKKSYCYTYRLKYDMTGKINIR